MNITEANDVNKVLSYLLGAGVVPSDAEAQAAAKRLAGKAHATLHAGLTADNVDRLWPGVLVGPLQEARP